MDLNQFKILKEADDSYEVGHPNGKKMSIKKAGLSEKAHALIKKIKSVKGYAEGGEVDQAPQAPPVASELPVPSPGQMMANNDVVRQATQAGMSVPEYLQSTSGPTPSEVNSSSASPMANAPAMPGELPPGGQAKASVYPEAMIAQKQGGIEQAMRKQEGFNQMEGAAQAEQGKQEAQAIGDTQAKVDQMPTQQDIVNQYKAKDDAYSKALMEKKIDPDRVWHNMSTGSKVGAGIAMILGGMGSGLTHQPNAALQILKDRIDADVDAQKNDQSKTMNLWKMNREALGNDLSANLATQNQMYTGLKYKIMQAGSQAASPIALARVGTANSVIDQQIAQNRMQQAMIQVGMGGTGPNGPVGNGPQDPSILVPHLIQDPAMQKQALDEIERAQNTKKNYQAIMNEFDLAAKDTRPMTGGSSALPNMIPGYESPHLKAMDILLGPTFGKLEGSVRQSLVDSMHDNAHPQAFDNDAGVATKRKALDHYLHSAASAPFNKSHGIDLSKFSSTSLDPTIDFTLQQRKFYDWAKANPQNPKAKTVLQKLGVPNG